MAETLFLPWWFVLFQMFDSLIIYPTTSQSHELGADSCSAVQLAWSWIFFFFLNLLKREGDRQNQNHKTQKLLYDDDMPIGLQSPNFGNSIVQIFCVTFILISGHEFAVLQWVLIVPELHPKLGEMLWWWWCTKKQFDEFGLNAVLLIRMLVWCI